VDGKYGCCDADGNVEFCNDGKTVTIDSCTAGLCSWDPFLEEYDCNLYFASPSSSHPIACPSM
jgi:hypothetical protein